ncbi:PepSY domain-containing protein [Vagococcus fessus]|uniref:PepSY domain-containing protein n=1 Tax=Vagococcus fessus TaxID=120370 RepID=A0A430A7B1_9ENTE|nr:PepSY domain-containing protein [Vagococcus fessus]RSU03013.1 hypothetical protein CBF31_04610 [Vagococcus fessus]
MKKNLVMVSIFGIIGLTFLTGCENKEVKTQVKEDITEKKLDIEELVKPDPNPEGVKIEVTLADAITRYQELTKDATVTEVELEKERGNWVYKIEGKDDTNDYKVVYDAVTKEVLDKETEPLDREEQDESVLDAQAIEISKLAEVEEILKVAEEKVKGSRLEEMSLEKNLGITYWEVSVRADNKKVKLKIDAISKELLEIKFDD